MNILASSFDFLGIGDDISISPDLELNKKKYNNLEPVLRDIQKAIALPGDEKIQCNSAVHQVLESIIKEMKAVDTFFKNTYKKNLYGGSYYDGLKLNSPDEYDLDLALKLPEKLNPCLEVSKIAGFVQIRVDTDAFKNIPNYVEYRVLEKFVDGSNCLLTEQFREWFEGVVSKAKNNLERNGSTHKFRIVKSGPAFTVKLHVESKLVSIDLVPSLIFNTDKWPGPPFRKNPTNQNEFLIVPKTPEKSTRYNTSWRLSFQEQEKVIMNGKNGLKDTIRLLKLLRNHQVQEKSIPSYYIKTVMMLMIEQVPDNYWSSHSRSYIFMMGLKYFCKILENKKLAYYWNRQYNLLNGKKDVTLENFSRRIDRIFKNLEKLMDSPTLRSEVLKYFGLVVLESQNQKDKEEIKEDTSVDEVDYNSNELLNLMKVELGSTAERVENICEKPIEKTTIKSLHTSPSNTKDVKDKTSNSDCTHERQLSLWRDSTEHEVFGIYVTKKLDRMDATQAIYAQKLISEILGQGLLNHLTATTNIRDNDQIDGLNKTSSSISLSSAEGFCCVSKSLKELL